MKQRNKQNTNPYALLLIAVMALCLAIIGSTLFSTSGKGKGGHVPTVEDTDDEDWITKQYLTPNDYSRSQKTLDSVEGIVVHYVANPGSTGWDNWHYFENLKDTHETKASSHFIIGLDGTIIQCMPLNEVAYCSNERNWDTISIECCHPKKNGKFTKETYKSLIKLCRFLMEEYDLSSSDVIRHYDVTGKICPKYFVDHPDAWEDFLSEL